MYDRNVPEVPTINAKSTIQKINDKVMQLDDEEKAQIAEILAYHGCEPSAAAERISDLLNVDYSTIYELID